VKRKGDLEYFIGRRYGDFAKLHKRIRTELPGKVLPTLPRKNKQNSTASNIISGMTGKDDDDASSVSSVSTMATDMQKLTVKDNRKSASAFSLGKASPRSSMDGRSIDTRPHTPGTPQLEVRYLATIIKYFPFLTGTNILQSVTLFRENQRISLRAFLRTLLSQPQIAQTKAMKEFLTLSPILPSDSDVDDIARRKAMDEKRVEEQKEFYEVARKRAAELDIYMEK